MTPVRTTTGSANADLLAMPGTGEVFSRTDSSGTVVPLHDLAGSTIGLVDGTGKIVTQYAYTPFGKPSMSGANNANPFQFAGMEYDSTGLYHTWERYYSPGLQRFLSEDPLGLAAGDTNIFAYVHNDPLGLDVCTISIGGGCTGEDCAPAPASPPPLGGSQGRPHIDIPVFPGQGVQGLNGLNGVNTLEISQFRAQPAQVSVQPGGITIQQFLVFSAVLPDSILLLEAGAAFVGDGATLVILAAVAGTAIAYRAAIASGTSEANAANNEHTDFGIDPKEQMDFDYGRIDQILGAPN